jgi:hypothetical protein
LRRRCKTAQPPLGANADRIEYAGADVAAHEKAARRPLLLLLLIFQRRPIV